MACYKTHAKLARAFNCGDTEICSAHTMSGEGDCSHNARLKMYLYIFFVCDIMINAFYSVLIEYIEYCENRVKTVENSVYCVIFIMSEFDRALHLQTYGFY